MNFELQVQYLYTSEFLTIALAIWVPIGSLFIFQGPYFQCFGLIHAKNVNLVCMYTAMSYLDLTVMSNDLHCYYMYIYIVK